MNIYYYITIILRRNAVKMQQYLKLIKKKRLFDLLVSLSVEFNWVSIQTLGRETLTPQMKALQ